jgi:hypothetical protein
MLGTRLLQVGRYRYKGGGGKEGGRGKGMVVSPVCYEKKNVCHFSCSGRLHLPLFALTQALLLILRFGI